MPELPEIETIRRGLERRVVGSRIVRVEVFEGRLRRPLDPESFGRLVGRPIRGVGRRAKYLVFDLGDDLQWIVHLGMSGRLVLAEAVAARGPHEHVRVFVEPGGVLSYSDPRRFGLMRVGAPEDIEELRGLGPEPLGADVGEVLHRRLRATRRDVKTALLDQRLVSGIGNIYANEILFRAGVRPTRRGIRLTGAEIRRIVESMREVLEEAVERRGTSFSDYFDSDGLPGSFQERLGVFDRAGEPCRRCGANVRRLSRGGRSSYYCPTCQK